MDFGIASVAAITVICYLIGQVVKASGVDNKWIPIACGVSGGLLGVACMALAVPDFPAADSCHGSGRGHRERLCGHRRQPGCQAAEQVTILTKLKGEHL